MRRTVQHMMEDILREYPELPRYIREREEELLHPVLDHDDNVGGGRAENKISDPTAHGVITIRDDRRLRRMEKECLAIDACLDESGEITQRIIKELYFKKYNARTIKALVSENIIPVSTSKAYELRNHFLETLAEKLDVDVM